MAATSIERTSVADDRFALWGVTVNDYKVGGETLDFESLVVSVAANRATILESQVQPLTVQVSVRNAWLKDLGNALSDLTKISIAYKSGAGGDTVSGDKMNQTTMDTLKKLTGSTFEDASNPGYILKKKCEEAIQRIKTEMDKLNNDSQSDMTRLQSLVSKRDESFTTASTIMSSVSDTRTNAIKAMGV